MNPLAVGAAAEQAAADHLKRCGARVLARNYRCRHGEIDIIAQDGGVVSFVEVRRRANFVAAADSIDDVKRRKVQLAAEYYLSSHGVDLPCRFDVVAVDSRGRLRWLKAAFYADE